MKRELLVLGWLLAGVLTDGAAWAQAPKRSPPPPVPSPPPASPSPALPAPAPAPAPAPPAAAGSMPAAETPTGTVATTPAPVAPAARNEPGRILLGVRFGGVFPEAFNKLDASFLPELEVAWQLPIPAIDRRLGLFFDVGYTQPTTSGTRTDPRVTANCGSGQCTESYAVTARDLGFSLGLHYWQPLAERFFVYGGVGGRMHLVRTLSEANAGSTSLGLNSEDSTKFGVVVRVGGAYRIGPGAITLEAHMEWTGIDHLITGGERQGESANIGNLALQAGYTLFFL